MEQHHALEKKLADLSAAPADVSLRAIISALRASKSAFSPEATEKLLQSLERESPAEQMMSATAIEQVRALVSGSPRARAMAAWALGNSKEMAAGPQLIAAMTAPEFTIRVNAAWAIGELQYRPAVDVLILALGDPDGWVRRHAAVALGKIGDPRAIEALSEQKQRETSVDMIANFNDAIERLRCPTE